MQLAAVTKWLHAGRINSLLALVVTLGVGAGVIIPLYPYVWGDFTFAVQAGGKEGNVRTVRVQADNGTAWTGTVNFAVIAFGLAPAYYGAGFRTQYTVESEIVDVEVPAGEERQIDFEFPAFDFSQVPTELQGSKNALGLLQVRYHHRERTPPAPYNRIEGQLLYRTFDLVGGHD